MALIESEGIAPGTYAEPARGPEPSDAEVNEAPPEAPVHARTQLNPWNILRQRLAVARAILRGTVATGAPLRLTVSAAGFADVAVEIPVV